MFRLCLVAEKGLEKAKKLGIWILVLFGFCLLSEVVVFD